MFTCYCMFLIRICRIFLWNKITEKLVKAYFHIHVAGFKYTNKDNILYG